MDIVLQHIVLMGVGVVFGLEHALEVDHVVAVTTLTSQSHSVRRATLLAAIWGLGHTATLFIVSLIVLLLKITISEQLGAFFELLIGMLLIALGANVMRMVLKGTLHSHTHEHGGIVHTHVHSHLHSHDHHHHNRRSFFVGIVHGLAGSSALVLLVLSSFNSLILGLAFVLCFGLGSVLGMCLITILLSIPFKLSLNSERVNRALQLVAGSAGVLMGTAIILNIITSTPL